MYALQNNFQNRNTLLPSGGAVMTDKEKIGLLTVILFAPLLIKAESFIEAVIVVPFAIIGVALFLSGGEKHND
jgi:hypothetical protein